MPEPMRPANRMNKRRRSYISSPSFLLFILFLVLKTTHVIDWSWWWITAPLWAPFALLVIAEIILALVGD